MAYIYMQQKNGSDELHIFKATLNSDKTWSKESDSVCGAIKWSDTGDVLYSKNTNPEVRTFSAELQNSRKDDICGNCIRRFYK